MRSLILVIIPYVVLNKLLIKKPVTQLEKPLNKSMISLMLIMIPHIVLDKFLLKKPVTKLEKTFKNQ